MHSQELKKIKKWIACFEQTSGSRDSGEEEEEEEDPKVQWSNTTASSCRY